MPLFKTINHDSTTQILVWKITESYHDLKKNVVLQSINELRISAMKSEIHQRAFLSVRKLLQQINLSDFDLLYDESGKPHLKTGQFISISHSHQFATIIISNQKVGIDVEQQRNKIIKIANKFSVESLNTKSEQNYIRKLTVLWGAKEAIFKIKNEKGISFKDHIIVQPFKLNQKKTQAKLNFNSKIENFEIHYHEIENYTLVYVLQGLF